ncbi:MAG: hypothetical protein R3Y43_07330 [Alphaproteobacteria bacterium]
MTKLQELVCTKINHDIIGTVGAVFNAVELLEDEDDGEILDDIKNILKTSSFVLVSRLKFFRVVFGSDNVSIDNIEEIVQNYVDTVTLKNYPIKVSVSDFDKSNLKALLLIAMMMPSIMIKGGSVDITGNSVKISSLDIKEDFFNNCNNLSNLQEIPSNSPYFYLKEVLDCCGKMLKFSELDNNIRLIEVV